MFSVLYGLKPWETDRLTIPQHEAYKAFIPQARRLLNPKLEVEFGKSTPREGGKKISVLEHANIDITGL